MNDSSQSGQGRVSKREYISRVARRAGVPVRVASTVYEAMIEELLTIVGSGDRLTLTGFGKFYPQEHKGHRVRFAGGDEPGEANATIEDYAVLKFSSTHDVNRRIGGGEEPQVIVRKARPRRARGKAKEAATAEPLSDG